MTWQPRVRVGMQRVGWCGPSAVRAGMDAQLVRLLNSFAHPTAVAHCRLPLFHQPAGCRPLSEASDSGIDAWLRIHCPAAAAAAAPTPSGPQ